jgi:hypothetical protein
VSTENTSENTSDNTSDSTSESTSLAWPYWMVRYMLMDDEESFTELLWSVGGSPPYGGISYEEAEAVYELIEDFRGAGAAAPTSYAAVHAFLGDAPERARVLELFRCYDDIVSASEAYSADRVADGLSIALTLDVPSAVALFILFQAGIAERDGDDAAAAKLTLEALVLLLQSAEHDNRGAKRIAQAAQNAVALTARSGDIARATALLDGLVEVIPPDAAIDMRRWLAQQH